MIGVPGIYTISEEDYHSDVCAMPSLSSSIAKILIADTPLHAWTAHPKLNPNFIREEKEIFDRGTVAHALLLQGLNVAQVVDVTNKNGEIVSDWKTKAAKEARAAARAEGKIPVLQCQWEAIRTMVARAWDQLAEHKEASDAFHGGQPEVTLIWEDAASDGTKVMCRARTDWLHDSHLIIDDYKSTGRDVNPENMGGKVVDDWDIQEAFYRRGLKKLTGKDARFRFVAQENTEPYALTVVAFGPDIQWMGDAKVQRAINTWAKCLNSGEWPGYPDRICYPVLPEWAEKRELVRQAAEIENTSRRPAHGRV